MASSPKNPKLCSKRKRVDEEYNNDWLQLSLAPSISPQHPPSPPPPPPPPSLSLSLSLALALEFVNDPANKTIQFFQQEPEDETLQPQLVVHQPQHQELQEVPELQETEPVSFFQFTHMNPSVAAAAAADNHRSPEVQEESTTPALTSTIHRSTTRTRRNPTPNPNDGEPTTLDPPPFPWTTERWATVHSMEYLVSKEISTIEGEVQCKKCEHRQTVSLDLRAKFEEVVRFVRDQAHLMHSRAPTQWMSPVLGACDKCKQPNCMRPNLDEKESHINWLFLFLGQWLGCCTLGQLKWFCKYTQNHRTGAKDRVLYYTYAAIGKQLDPAGVFTFMQS